MRLVKKHQTSKRSTFRPHRPQRTQIHVLSPKSPFLFCYHDKYHCQVFTTTSLKYQAIHTHNLTQHKEDRDIFFKTAKWHLQNVSKEWQRHFLVLTKRTMFPLRHYRAIAFQWGGEGGEAVKINTKQNSTCRMTVCRGKLKKLLRTQVSLIILHKFKECLVFL